MNIAYGKYKDLAGRKELDKMLKGKTFTIASNPNYDRYQQGLALMVYKIFNKKYVGSDVATLTNKYMPNQQLEN